MINHRGVTPMLVSSVWKINIPLRVQFFLWLLSNNRILTRDNLAKRRNVSDPTILFCNEESISHLFFEYYVAGHVWQVIGELPGLVMGDNFESIARFWVANKRHKLTNCISSSVLCSLWKLRNEICFQVLHGQV